jgi:hypothetical protein
MGVTGKTSSSRKRVEKSSTVSEDKEEGRMSLFQRLFAPESIDTDASGDSDSGSLDSATHFSDMSGSDDEDNDDSTQQASATSSMIKFDRDLRARHRGACKNMTVRIQVSISPGAVQSSEI